MVPAHRVLPDIGIQKHRREDDNGELPLCPPSARRDPSAPRLPSSTRSSFHFFFFPLKYSLKYHLLSISRALFFFFTLFFSFFSLLFSFYFFFHLPPPPPNTRMFLRRVYQITRGDKRAKVRFLEGLDNWGAIKEMKRMTENQRLLSDGGTPSGEAGLGPFGRGRLYFSLGAFGFLPTFFSQVLKSGLWGRPWHRCSFWWGTE